MTTIEPGRIARTPIPDIVPFEPQWGTENDDPAFRFPAPDDPAPSPFRLLAMTVCAAVLGLTGTGVGLLTVIGAIRGAPGWYLPLISLFLLLSVVPAGAAFLAIHRGRLPWVLLAGAATTMTAALLTAARL
ncbi:hypothetical protein [Actinoplanes sp. NPDC051851]|uniref:hypothetical protein n=1 Tax=Actinoplanes sp. NPDC051851 TaxID=3154753 RepID=UPI0034396E2E